MFNFQIKKGIINIILMVIIITLNSTSFFTSEMISGIQSQIKAIVLLGKIILGQTLISQE